MCNKYVLCLLICTSFFVTVTVESATSDNVSHYCTYRYFVPYPEYQYKLVTGWSCYNYAHPKWLVGGKPLRKHIHSFDGQSDYPVPYVKGNGTTVVFDFEEEHYLPLIRDLHTEERFFQKWMDCAQAAMDCCRNHLNDDNIIPNEHYPCPAMWDGYTCYAPAKENTLVKQFCPRYLTSSEKFVCNLTSTKECTADGWNQQTEYAQCSSSFRLRERHTFHIVVLAIASAFVFPSIIIFLSYEQLRHVRFAMHRNVIAAIFAKNVLVIVSKNVIIMNAINVQQEASVIERDDVWCRVLTVIDNLSKNLIFSCMTADAYYSHKSIARPFAAEPSEYLVYALIAVASCLPTIVWATMMSVNEVGKCWVSDSSGLQWITDSYKYACLVINVALLVDILRVLLMKLQKNPGKHPGRIIKATIILICLFGLPLLISSQRNLVDMDDCIASDIYTYTTYSIEALQGIFMALFFCYLNPDVINALKRSWVYMKSLLNERRLVLQENRVRRRTTQLTLVPYFDEPQNATRNEEIK